MADDITQERLKELFSYDPETGEFVWLIKRRGTKGIGRVAGWPNKLGYIYIALDKKKFCAHRLAWLYVHGEMPDGEIDHINRDPSDNRIANLRVSTRAENLWNIAKPVTNTSGYKNVYVYKGDCKRQKRYNAMIKVNGRRRSLGYFHTAEEAHEAYCEAAKRLHGEFARTA